MAITQMFGRRERRDPPLLAIALAVAADVLALGSRWSVDVVAHGDSEDYPEWVTVRFQGASTSDDQEVADAFMQRITRFGVTLV